MLKFFLGVVLGACLAVGYVRYELALPQWLHAPQRLGGNLVSSVTEIDLYDLDKDEATRRRALEVYFASRAADAVRTDAEAGHPFLEALYRERATREARQLLSQRGALSEALNKPALREALERKHGTRDEAALQAAQLLGALDRSPFLKQWIERRHGTVTAGSLDGVLRDLARLD